MASTTLLLLLLLLVVAADVHSLTNANLPHASRSPRDSSFLNGKTSLNLAESTGGSHSSNAAETSVDGSVVNSLAIDSSVDIVAEGVATVPSSIFNLAKTILGAGILSLPSGVAAFSDSKTALLPATLLLVSLGNSLSTFCVTTLLYSCSLVICL